MIKKGQILTALFVVLSFWIGNLRAELITIYLTAEVTFIDQTEDWFNGQIKVGDIITSSYTYDSSTQDSSPLETVGIYNHYSSPYGISMTAGGFVFQTNPENVDFLVSIGNNHMYSSWDNYGVTSYQNLPLYEGVYVNVMGWGLQDSSGTALSSDALPTTPPVLEDWDALNRLTIWGSHDQVGGGELLLSARVTSAIPEPTTILLLALGSLLLTRRRR